MDVTHSADMRPEATMTSTPDVTQTTSLPDGPQTTITNRAPVYLPWDNPRNIISQETLHTNYLVLACGLALVLCLLGIPGNILNMLVFARQGLRDRVNFVLFVLALSDTAVLLGLLALRSPCFIGLFDQVLARNVDSLMSVTVYYILYGFAVTSQIMVAILSVDRCISITFPFATKRFVSLQTVAVTSFLTSAFFIGIQGTQMFRHYFVWITDPATNRTIVLVKDSRFGLEHRTALYALAREVTMLVVKPVVTIIIITCSLITVTQIRRARRVRKDMTQTKTSSSDAKITKMLLFVSAVSVACVIPEIVVAFVNVFEPEFEIFKTYHNIFLLIFYLLFVSLSVNASTNFVVYIIMSSKYRVTLASILPCCGRCLKKRKLRRPNTEQTELSTVNTNAETVVSSVAETRLAS